MLRRIAGAPPLAAVTQARDDELRNRTRTGFSMSGFHFRHVSTLIRAHPSL